MPPKKAPPPPKTTPHKRQRPSPKAKKPAAAEPKFAIQAEDLNVSGFCVTGANTRAGPPGGAYYEKAKSRHRRHREVYRSSAEGQAVAQEAVPLGGGGKRRPETSARRKAIFDAAKKKAAASAARVDGDGAVKTASSKPKQSST